MRKSESKNHQFKVFEKNQNKGQFHLFQKHQRTTGFHERTSRSLGGSCGYTVEPSMVTSKQTPNLTNLPNHGIPWSTFGNAVQSSTRQCALLSFHRWFSFLKINFKLILARFQENSEVQPTSMRIALG